MISLLSFLNNVEFSSTLFAPSDFAGQDKLIGIEHVSFAIGSSTSPLKDLAASIRLSRLIQGKYDLIHAHGIRGALIGVTAGRLAGIPAIFTAHNLTPVLKGMPRFILSQIGKSSGTIVAVSQAVRQSLIINGIAEAKIRVIPNGIDLALYNISVDAAAIRSSFGIPVNAPLIVSVGRLSPEKGFDVLIKAFELLLVKLPDAYVILAGSGPEEARLRAMSSGQDAIILPGAVTDVIPIVMAADVVAIPSREEGQGIVALEAMAASKPLVASRVGGLVETIADGKTGILVPVEDQTALSDALFTMLTNSGLRAQMGRAGRERVEAEYTIRKMIARIESLYRLTSE